jgi:hypothetical protein
VTKHLALALAALAAPLAAQLNTIQTVYLLPMSNGLDQHLANRLTAAGVFQVVTDPLKADAVFTDRLGETFETRFTELYIAPGEEKKQAEEKKAQAEEKRARQKERKAKGLEADKEETADVPAEGSKVVDKGAPRTTSFGRGRGTLFLVERKTRNVVWSVYDVPKGSSPQEMDRLAGRMADRLKKALSVKSGRGD